MRLICVRHGQTDANAEGFVQGHTDFTLNEHGTEQARTLQNFLSEQGFDIDAVYSSDLSRAVETARLACPDYDLSVDKRFREQDFGVVVGDLSEYLDEHPEFRLTSKDAFNHKFPEGESVQDVYNRVTNGVEDLLSTHDAEETILLVCHFTPMLCLVSYALDEPLHETWASEHFENSETLVFNNQDGKLEIENRHSPVA